MKVTVCRRAGSDALVSIHIRLGRRMKDGEGKMMLVNNEFQSTSALGGG